MPVLATCDLIGWEIYGTKEYFPSESFRFKDEIMENSVVYAESFFRSTAPPTPTPLLLSDWRFQFKVVCWLGHWQLSSLFWQCMAIPNVICLCRFFVQLQLQITQFRWFFWVDFYRNDFEKWLTKTGVVVIWPNFVCFQKQVVFFWKVILDRPSAGLSIPEAYLEWMTTDCGRSISVLTFRIPFYGFHVQRLGYFFCPFLF